MPFARTRGTHPELIRDFDATRVHDRGMIAGPSPNRERTNVVVAVVSATGRIDEPMQSRVGVSRNENILRHDGRTDRERLRLPRRMK